MYKLSCDRCGNEVGWEVSKEILMNINHMIMENPSTTQWAPFQCPECGKPQFISLNEVMEDQKSS